MLANPQGSAALRGVLYSGGWGARFDGAPLIVCGDGLRADTDPRWLAALAMVEAIGRPRARPGPPAFGFNVDPGSTDDPTMMESALRFLSRFHDVSGLQAYQWIDATDSARRIQRPLIVGPVLAIASTVNARPECRNYAAAMTDRYVRQAGGPYGIGCMGVGPMAVPESRASPPVYDVGPDFATALPALLEVWRRGGPTSVQGYALLQEWEARSPGISRRVHPAIAPYITPPP